MTTNEKTNDDPPKFSQATLQHMLLKNNYSFPDSHFEPSSDKLIDGKDIFDKNQLTEEALEGYLKTNYRTGGKLKLSKTAIEEIIGSHRLKKLVE